MGTRKNQILLGVILLLIGVYTIAVKYFNINYGSFPVVMFGGTLILLYYTKNKPWALMVGSIVLLCGMSNILRHIPVIGDSLLGALLFMLPGIILILMYIRRKNICCIIPGCFAVWIGIFIILSSIPMCSSIAGALFFICFGLAFLSSYFISNKRLGVWTVILSSVMFIIGIFFMIGINPVSIYFNYSAYLGSLVLIAFSIFIIIKGIKNKN